MVAVGNSVPCCCYHPFSNRLMNMCTQVVWESFKLLNIVVLLITPFKYTSVSKCHVNDGVTGEMTRKPIFPHGFFLKKWIFDRNNMHIGKYMIWLYHVAFQNHHIMTQLGCTQTTHAVQSLWVWADQMTKNLSCGPTGIQRVNLC